VRDTTTGPGAVGDARPALSRGRGPAGRDARTTTDGSSGTYSVVDKPDFAVVIAHENDGFHLVEQFRYPIRRRSREFPQGGLPPEHRDGTPEELAAAELSEETGFTAGSLTELGYVNCANGTLCQGLHPGRLSAVHLARTAPRALVIRAWPHASSCWSS
jgi:8-oxo-dGTP pyrophosphatase MutT (NUDIX family)